MSTVEVPYGSIEENKIILNPWKDHPNRVIGEVREEGEAVAVEYFVNRFNELEQKIAELEKTIEETENKGSYLQKVLHLKGSLETHDALGDYAALDDRLEVQQKALEEIIAKNRVRNTEIKHTLIAELREAVDGLNWKECQEAILDIKGRWIKVGNAVAEEQQQLDDTFWGEVQNFFDRKRAFFEDRKRLEKKHEDDYWTLIKESQHVWRLGGKERFEKVKELQERWREVGNIPSFKYKNLLQKFQRNLKQSGPRLRPDDQLKQIQNELLQIQQGNKPFDRARADEIRRALFAIKPRDPKTDQRKRDCVDLLQLLSEMDFVQNLCEKRFDDYHDKNVLEQNALHVKVLKELVARDEEELRTFEDNAGNFSASDDNGNHMVNRKLAQQRNKIKVKQRLISILGG